MIIAKLALTALTLAAFTPAMTAQAYQAEAVPGLRLVTATVGPGSPQEASVTAPCQEGFESILGVGATVAGARGQAGLAGYTHIERPWGSAFAVEDLDGTTANWSLTAYAICATIQTDDVVAFSASNSNPQKAVTVTCPTGALVTGAGGYASSHVTGGTKNLILDDAAPSADLRSVTVDTFEGQGGVAENWGANVVARCTTPLPGQRRITATSASDSVSPKVAVANCPAGQVLIGTGHEIANGRGQVLLDDVEPNAGLTSLRVEAFEDQDGTTANWSVTAHAVCANA